MFYIFKNKNLFSLSNKAFNYIIFICLTTFAPCLTHLKKVINPRDKLINHAKLLSDRFKKNQDYFPLLYLNC